MLSTDLFVFDMIFEVFLRVFFFCFTQTTRPIITRGYEREVGFFFKKKEGKRRKKIKEKEKKQIVTIYLQMMFHIYLIES